MYAVKKNGALRFASFLLTLALLLCCTGCGKNNDTTLKTVLTGNSVNDIYPQDVNSKLHITDVKSLKPAAASGLIELFIDSTTYSVAVKETLKKKFWYSLPAAGNEGYDNSAAAVTLDVVSGGDTWHLNSQDNSVAFNNATYKADSSSITVTYILTKDMHTAGKSKYDTGDIAFSVTVKYALKDGSLYITGRWKNLSGNPNAKIEYMGILEFFGASSGSKPGDFLLVPDGCGALINTAVAQPDFKPLEFKIYGDDAANPGGNEAANTAVVAAYGIKQGESALAVIIEKGDALASICADRSTGKSGFNKVGARFEITPVSAVTKGKKSFRCISQNSYGDDIKLCLRFVTGSNASYSGIAAVCREQLIRDNVLSTKTVDRGDYLPFNLAVVGEVKRNRFTFGSLTGMAKLTTFEQAQDMITRMKSKGINSIYLRYKGALSGGLNQSDITKARISSSLGGDDGFAELYKYMSAQKMELYLDINLLSSNKQTVFSSVKNAKTISYKNAGLQIKNELSDYIGDQNFNRSLRTVSSLEPAVIKELTRARYTDFTGFCLNDAGRTLYSDYSGNGYNRQAASYEMAKQLSSLATGRKLMSDTGNFFTIKNVDVVVNMPLETVLSVNSAYQAVPFVQLIMHGIVDYSGVPINEAGNVDDMMLRYIEYGACPSYEWYYTKINENPEDAETFYYEDWINQAVAFYTKANDALYDLQNSRMTKHTKIADGVFCTEYDGRSLIYVNYTNKDAEAGGYTVKARDFIRIN